MSATVSANVTNSQPTTGSRVATLYVGDLAPDVSEPTLYDFFSKHGPVVSVRVCRDMHSQISLGYSYVNFQNADDATRVIELLNYTPLKPGGKPMRIMWYQRDPSLRKSGMGNVFVKDLNREIDDKQLCDVFSVFGTILSTKVSRDKDGKSNGYGFVHFEKQEDAKEAIEKMNGMMINGVKVYVGEFKRRKERSAEMENTFSNVFFRNIASNVTEEALTAYLSHFGKVLSICLRESEKFTTKFGFANFESHTSAQRCIDECNDVVIANITGSEPMYASRALKQRERMIAKQIEMLSRARERQVANLFVKNLPDSIDDAQLREMFQGFGSIISCKVQREPTTKVPKGFGYVAFFSKECAERAVAELNGKIIQGKPLYIAYHQTSEQRRRQLEQRRQAHMGPYRWPGFGPTQTNNAQQAPVPPSMPSMFPYSNPWQPNSNLISSGYYNAAMRPNAVGSNLMNKPPSAFPRTNYPSNMNSTPRMNVLGPHMIRPGQPNLSRPIYGANPYMNSTAPPSHPVPTNMPAYRTPNTNMPPQRSTHHNLHHSMQQRPVNSLPQHAVPQSSTKSIPGMQGLPTLTSTQLAAMSSEEQKNALGERLYARIYAINPEQAAKITGMLLEMDTTEILNVLEDDTVMHNKIDEAIAVLRAHHEK